MLYCKQRTLFCKLKSEKDGCFAVDNALFCNTFAFREYRFSRYHYTDARDGVGTNFLGYMKSGRARLVSAREEIEVGEGELFYIPMGCRYESYWYGEPEIRFDSLAFQLFPQAARTRYPLQRIGPLAGGEAALRESLSGGVPTDCASVSRLYALLASLLPRMIPEAETHEEELVRRALSYMQAHADEDVPAVASACRVSQSTLYAAFRTQRGETPVHARQRLLVERAVTLLHTTDLPVEQISAQLGFSSPAYFRRVLRMVLGQTPREIRRRAEF